MYQLVLNAIFRSIIASAVALAMTRFMGRKAISQITFFDFIVGISIGSVTASLSLGQDRTVTTGITVLVALTLLASLTGYLHIKSVRFRKLVNSEPVVAVENGKIIDKNIKKLRFTVGELMSQLREKNVFNIADVEFAIIENDGVLSVLPKSQKQPVTPSDLNIPTNYKGLTRDLVIDGNILHENLRAINLDEPWLLNQLKNQGVFDVNEVFFARLDTAGNLYVSKKGNRIEKHGEYGIE